MSSIFDISRFMNPVQNSSAFNSYILSNSSSILDIANKYSNIFNSKVLIQQNTSKSVIAGLANSDLYTLIAKQESQKFNAVFKNEVVSLNNKILENPQLYERQLEISEKFAKVFSSTTQIALEKYQFYKPIIDTGNKSLNNFDFLSALTHYNVSSIVEEQNTKLELIYDDIETLLQKLPKLSEEIVKLQSTVLSLRDGQNNIRNEDSWYSLISFNDLLEWFLNKVLIRKLKINPTTARIILLIAVSTVLKFSIEIFIEAKGSDIYRRFESKTNESESVPNVVNIYQINKNDISDFTITKTPIYLRNSEKTKKLGFFPTNCNVLILKMKGKWCLVEGTINVNTYQKKVKNNKFETLTSKEKTIRGWIKKENLDMFQ